MDHAGLGGPGHRRPCRQPRDPQPDEPRPHEWVDIDLADGGKLNTWVVYPERGDKGGVVLVIHDIRGLSDWARAVADQLAGRRYVGRLQLGEGIEALWYDAFVHADDIRSATGRPSERGDGLPHRELDLVGKLKGGQVLTSASSPG